MARAKATADWCFGLLAGVLAGFGFAMIFIDPQLITPDSAARRYVTIAGIGGAMVVMLVRNRMAARLSPPGGPTDPDPAATADRESK